MILVIVVFYALIHYVAGMALARQRPTRREQEIGSSLAIHNIVVDGHRTSVRLEPVMWDALREIARSQRLSIHDLATEVDRQRTESSLTAAIRVYIVNYYRNAALLADRTRAPATGQIDPRRRTNLI